MGISAYNIPVTPAVPLSNTAALPIAANSVGTGLLAAREDHSHALVDSGWIAPTLLNGWINYGAPFDPITYRKIGNIVFVRGLAKNGTLPGIIFTLPAGYRPTAQLIVAVVTNSNTIGRLDVLGDGGMQANAGSNGWFSVVCSFTADQ